MKTLLILLITIFPDSFCGGQNQKSPNGSVLKIVVKTFIEKSSAVNAIILDVRTPQEFNSGHIEGAINIDYNSDDFKNQISGFDKEKTYLLYCHSGNRSGKSGKILQKEGFKELYDLDGGISAWKDGNKPVVK